MAIVWMDDSVFFTAAGRQGIHVWRQRISPTTFEPIGPPELMTPGSDSAFFPAVGNDRAGDGERRHADYRGRSAGGAARELSGRYLDDEPSDDAMISSTAVRRVGQDWI
jgi:hypothetical protein